MDGTIVDETMLIKFDWWVYVIIVCSVFSIALALNYIVKKINDARLEQRVRVLHNKPSVTHSVQFRIPAEPRPLTIKPPDNHIPEQDQVHKKISLIFNKERELIEDSKNTVEKVLVAERRDVEVIEDAFNTISASDRSGSSHDEYIDSVSVSGRSSPHSTNTMDKKPAFLGKIYKDLQNESKMNIKGILISKEISNSKETIPTTTVNQIKIARSRESIKVEQNKVKTANVDQNKDINDQEEHSKTQTTEKVTSSKALDNDSIVNEVVEKMVLEIRDSKSNTKI